MYIGGVHIHHQVWGILLVLVVGLLEFRFSPQPPWQEVLAALFGPKNVASPLIAFVGAVRLAKPSSFSARGFYSQRKMARAGERFGERHLARQEHLRDLFSGGR